MYLLPGGVMGLARRLWARWPAAGAAEPEPDSADRRPQPRAGARSEDVVQGIPGGSSR
jgi:hypothetical protein